MIQGLALDQRTVGQLDDLVDTETGVWVPRNLAEQLVQLLAAPPDTP